MLYLTNFSTRQSTEASVIASISMYRYMTHLVIANKISKRFLNFGNIPTHAESC